MKNQIKHFITKAFIVVVFVAAMFSEAFSEPLVNISLSSKRVQGEYYFADVWVNVPDNVNSWTVASATILINYNGDALSMEGLNGIDIENLDFALLQNNCSVTQTQFDDNQLALNIFTTNPNVLKLGTFRIGTLKWKIKNGKKLDNLKFYTNNIEIFDGMKNMLKFDCNTPDCYKIDEPVATVVDDLPNSDENAVIYNTPNPTNGNTDIHFNISKSGNVKISIYSVDGRLIENFVDGYYTVGSYSKQFNSGNLPSGMYSILLSIDQQQVTTKMIIQK